MHQSPSFTARCFCLAEDGNAVPWIAHRSKALAAGKVQEKALRFSITFDLNLSNLDLEV